MNPRRKRSTKPRWSYLLGLTTRTRRDVTAEEPMVSRLQFSIRETVWRCPMDQALTIAFVVIAAIVRAFLVLGMTRRRSQELKRRFGTEYDRLVAERGGPRRAEAELAPREGGMHAVPVKNI